MNLFPAYNYMYPTYSYDQTQDLIQVLKTIETVLNLAFPFLIGATVAVLLCVRILQLIYWIGQCLFTFIQFCSKYKLS